MYARTAFLLAAALLTALAVMPRTAQAAAPMRLIVTPAQGHAGDPIFLSGSGFAARQPVSIFLRCGSQSPAWVTATTANGLGRFAGVRIRLSLPKRVGRCTFSAASRTAPSTRTKARPYTFVPAGRPLAECTVHMCLRVQAFLVRLKNGARGNIVISGWPGAIADVTIARTQTGTKYRELRLNWRGVGSVTTPVAPGLLKGLKARVFVRAHLGRVRGQSVTSFHVMFGNR
jgi:hypothetical protein